MNQEIKDRIEQIRQEIIPAGYKQYRNDIFPSDWEVKQLKDIAPLQRGFDLPASKVNIGDTPVCYSNGISRYHNEYKVEGPGVVTGRSGTIGNVFYITDNFWPHNTTLWVTDFKRNVEKFVYYLYKYIKLERFHAGTGVPTLNRNDVHMHKIPIPNKVDEQQKIADILSTWDRAIELKESLIKEKEEQKKGLMQELLTPVNSNQWFKLKLRDLGKTYNGLTGKTRKDFGTGKKFITFKNIFDNSKLNLNVFDRVLLKEGEKQNMIKYGDVFFTTSSETPHEVGMSSVLLDEIEEDIYLNSFCFGFRLNSFEEVLPEFLRYCLRGDSFRYEMMRLAQGSTRFNLSKTEFLKTTLEVPSISQQHRIAKILSTADQEIDLLKQEVEQLKEQKKGLMQLLLTGIVRVKEAVTSG
ncbi:MAG TPA: hypothetical protein GXZ58_10555 [Bacilli bacterium]|nr:hypothetical protein [Bacilli bacterium]